MSSVRTIACDLLVVGSGLAGLRAAYDAAAQGLRVVIASKGKLCSGASFYPLTGALGAQLPKDEQDKPTFLSELLDSGDGIADARLCAIMVDEITQEINRFSDLGIETYDASGRPACFAKNERRLAAWTDWDTIRANVNKIFAEIPKITTMVYCDLQRLVIHDGRIAGALMVDSVSEYVFIQCPTVLLASGGYCGLYKHSLNTDDVCGIGHSVALDAGAELINLEFMQFIPGLTHPVYKLLFGEISLWHCKDVLDSHGEPVLQKSLPSEVSLAQCLQQRSMHGPFTSRDDSRYFDIVMMRQCKANRSAQGFTLHYHPSIDEDPNPLVDHIRRLYHDFGIDLAKQPISIAPFAHCANGGIWINEHGETSVPGLFSAGEAAGGIHGADRHGGAATAVCLVFGHRAAQKAATYVKMSPKAPAISGNEVLEGFLRWIDNGAVSDISALDILHRLSEELWFNANVIRQEKSLTELLAWIQSMRSSYNPARALAAGDDTKMALKAFHALRVAEALITAMLARKESRGPHYREDYPARDAQFQNTRFVASECDSQITVRSV
jgi:fumarate reductase (CoM/CoB) subunit A